MTTEERAEETFRLIRALKRMDASMIPVIKQALDDAIAQDRADRTKSYARCPACGQMAQVADGKLIAHMTKFDTRCGGEGTRA